MRDDCTVAEVVHPVSRIVMIALLRNLPPPGTPPFQMSNHPVERFGLTTTTGILVNLIPGPSAIPY